MNFRPSRARLGAVLLIGALLAAVIVVLVVRQDDRLPDDAAFEVTGEVVTVAELEGRVEVLESLYGVKAPTDSDESEDFRKAAAQAVALSVILDRAADERDIVIADRAASDVLDKIIQSEFPELGREGYVRTLGNSGVTEDDVLEEIKRQMAIQQLFDEVTQDVSVRDGEVRAAFAERREALASPETRRISNIVVSTRQQAMALANRLTAGADFSGLVRQHSLDGSTRARGGDLGFVSKEELESSYGTAAFAARQGQMFGPVRSSHGWNVGVVRQIRPGQPATYDQVAQTLEATLRSEQALEAWRDFMQDELHDADVLYADTYRPKDPDALPESGPMNAPASQLPSPDPSQTQSP